MPHADSVMRSVELGADQYTFAEPAEAHAHVGVRQAGAELLEQRIDGRLFLDEHTEFELGADIEFVLLVELGVGDLERVAGSMQLAGEQGARVRESLATQAEALRARQIAEIEANAQAATERMGLPTVLLFVGFIALLGYPALHLVIGQM